MVQYDVMFVVGCINSFISIVVLDLIAFDCRHLLGSFKVVSVMF